MEGVLLRGKSEQPRRKLSPREVSEQWGIATDRVLGWIRSGQLRAINAAGDARSKKPRWLIDVEDLAAFERSRSTSPVSSPNPSRRSRRMSTVPELY